MLAAVVCEFHRGRVTRPVVHMGASILILGSSGQSHVSKTLYVSVIKEGGHCPGAEPRENTLQFWKWSPKDQMPESTAHAVSTAREETNVTRVGMFGELRGPHAQLGSQLMALATQRSCS